MQTIKYDLNSATNIESVSQNVSNPNTLFINQLKMPFDNLVESKMNNVLCSKFSNVSIITEINQEPMNNPFLNDLWCQNSK